MPVRRRRRRRRNRQQLGSSLGVIGVLAVADDISITLLTMLVALLNRAL